MRTRCAPGRTHVPNHLTTPNRLAGADREAAQMSVAGREAESVMQDDHVPVVAGPARGVHLAVRRRVDRLAALGRYVDALMETIFPGEGIASAAEAGRQPAVRRPQRRRRV